MRKFRNLLLAVFLLGILACPVLASEPEVTEGRDAVVDLYGALEPLTAIDGGAVYTTIDLQDESLAVTIGKGSSTVIAEEEEPSQRANRTVRKVYTYHASDGEPLFQTTLRTAFLYTPAGPKCIESECTADIFDDRWYLISKRAEKDGSVATGEVVMGRTFLGVPVDREIISMVLILDGQNEME